jgi:hypothetical protein
VEFLGKFRHLEGKAVNAAPPVLFVGLFLGVEFVEDELCVLLDVLREEGGGVDVVGARGVGGRLRAKQLAIMFQAINVLEKKLIFVIYYEKSVRSLAEL